MADMTKVLAARRRKAMIAGVAGVSTTRGNMKGPSEHEIQRSCITWMKYAMPTLARVTFAVPNGGLRDSVTQSMLKDEGLTSGVADIIVLCRNRYHGALCIEMKTQTGRQSDDQKRWQRDCEDIGGQCYRICRSLEQFQDAVIAYCAAIDDEKISDEARRAAASRRH